MRIYQKYLVYFGLIFLIISVPCIQPVVAQQVKLSGTVEGKTLKLYWDVRGWPSDLYGFNLKRKEGNFGDWLTLNSSPISPRFSEKNNWKNQGLDSEQASVLAEKQKEYFNSGKLNYINTREILEMLIRAEGLKSGDRIRMKNDFDYALMAGFGYIDNLYDEDKNYIYGIFFVANDLSEHKVPLATFSVLDPKLISTDVLFEKIKTGINIQWKIAEEDIQSYGIFGFNVYRKDKGDKSSVKLNNEPLGYLNLQADTAIWQFIDIHTDNTKNHTYIIAPVNMFQEEVKHFKEIYNSKIFKTVVVPDIDTIFLVNDIDVMLKWNNKTLTKDKTIKGIIIERTKAGKNDFTAISGILSTKTNNFTDSVQKDFGEYYLYRIAVLQKSNNKWVSQANNFLFLGELKPQSPKGLKAEFKLIQNQPYVVLSWNSYSSNDSITKGYILANDEINQNEFLIDGGLQLITENHIVYPISINGGREIKFRIIPVSKDAVHGEPAEISCYVPMKDIPGITELEVNITEDNFIKLNWKYPSDVEIKGFNILVNGMLVADYKNVASTAREWIIKSTDSLRNGTNKFVVQAVGDISSSNSLPQSLYLSNKDKLSITRVKNLKSKIIKEDDSLSVLLEWDKLDFEKENVLGYILYADNSQEGILMKQSSIPLIKTNKYQYFVDNKDRKRLSFGIAVMNNKREVGSYTKIEVDLK